ncbi:hypothetical protein [Pseudomonas sp. NFACC37-1]|uniref:hypothetical protein n=1 Tax=Pseudomonas sp. NFACC37-1 TaxID=1566196 RepID=UPI00088CD9C7|nr:hypothetical protein [Pseudomonas sp. NFACC37-1]SCZ12612.1 hypothetical protein SAMN03159391_05717 [Pseudomonas sp. NFACC37-1]
MNDQQLLERAARAAGIGPILCYEKARNCLRIGDRKQYRLWRPLDDDGDALRLAVALLLDIEWWSSIQCVTVQRRGFGETIAWLGEESRSGALRRAITGVAAKIGITLP